MEQVFNTVHIEGKGESQCLVERVTLSRCYDVTGIQREHTHLESGTNGEVLSVTLVLTLMVITCTNAESVVVGILQRQGSTGPPAFPL